MVGDAACLVYSADSFTAVLTHAPCEERLHPMAARRRFARPLTSALLVVWTLSMLTGCGLPPALSKADLDAAKLPEKHPTITTEQVKAGCRSCHREQETVKQR